MVSSISAPVDVLIVGAGPAGAASAILLARSGARVALVDRAHFPRPKPCSEFMSPEGARVLSRLGVLERLEQLDSEPLDGLTVHAPRGSRLTGLFALAAVAPWRSTGLSIQRSQLDAELVRAASAGGVAVYEGLAFTGLLRQAGAVAGAVFRDERGVPHSMHARLTIGADGLRSRVARQIGTRRHGHFRRYAFVTHMRNVHCAPRQAEMFVSERGYAGINPVGGGLANVALVVPAEDARLARGDAAAFFLSRCRADPAVRERLRDATLADQVHVTGPFDVRASRVIADGVALVGDAADFFDPFTGDGIVSALRGAELLADILPAVLQQEGIVRGSALAPYRRARRRAFAGKRLVSRLIATAMHFPVLFDHLVARLEARTGMAHTLIGVTGEFVPARAVLNPAFLGRMVL